MLNTHKNLILVGAPNSGKTSLFNKLTGSQKEVMNYPGSTTTISQAPLKKQLHTSANTVIDTPGIYGLGDNSLEEQQVLRALSSTEHTVVICVIDLRFLSHRIELLKNLQQRTSHKIIVYATHAAKSNISLDELNKEYGVPFIDSSNKLALKTLLYAIENVHIQQPQSVNFTQRKETKSIDLDAWLLHPYLGFTLGFLTLISMFTLTFYLMFPLSEYIEILIDQLLTYNINGPLRSFPIAQSLTSGLLLGIGTLIMFVPQVIGLFFVVLLIQESGYLARAAIIFDPLLSKFGLHGKSIAPILAGFSCAIPAILLTKTIESKREKLLTILAVPFMTCSARVPIYTLCISFLFYDYAPWISGVAFAACYMLSLILGCIAAAVLNKFTKEDTASFLMMELPPYKLPNPWKLFKNSANKSFVFVKNAGPIIVFLSTLIWATTTFPAYNEPNPAERLNQSYAAKFGQFIEPAFKPMGLEWRAGTAILTSFAAREVFVSSLSLFLGQDLTQDSGRGVFNTLREVKNPDGSPVFSFASTVAILIFFVLALQCTSTTAITAKELNSWRMAIYQFVFMNIFAYIVAVILYQTLIRI